MAEPRTDLMGGLRRLPWRIAELITSAFMGLLGVLLWGVNALVWFIIVVLTFIARILNTVIVYVPRVIGAFIPQTVVEKLDQLIIYAGIEMMPEEVVGITLVYSVIITVITYLVAKLMGASFIITVASSVIIFVSIWSLPYIILNLMIYRRTESVENALPDVLDMVAQNMAAGMTSYNALWAAARPEFGPLAIEIQNVARSTLTGMPLTDSLIMLTNRIKSDKLNRSIRLIIQGMKSGGELPTVLQGISMDMRAEQILQGQMRAETNAHALFIMFALLIGAPLLFGVSLRFITTFSALFSKLNVAEVAKIPKTGMISLTGMSISPSFFLQYSILILSLLGFFGALLIGLIRTGRAISGIYNIPVFILISVGVFLLINYLLGTIFGVMFTI